MSGMEDERLTILWRFAVKPGKEEEFERIYGPDGDWAVLFRKGDGYGGTELHKSRETPRSYLVIDRWRSLDAFKQFKQRFTNQYRALDLRCEELTEKEEHVGDFTAIGGAVRQLVSSGSPFERNIGMSRAVRVGSFISVSGTAPIKDGKAACVGDAAAQARVCLEIIRKALADAGAGLENVIRTRTLLTRIEDWESVAKVHGEYFADIRPANTVMQVGRFIDPDWLVEIEADAVVS
jgi:enamine deaminase RidA (YjgF/YER057c/UK114 family)